MLSMLMSKGIGLQNQLDRTREDGSEDEQHAGAERMKARTGMKKRLRC